ncbi:Voltage-dependent calcium channel subunit alpha-2/delta-2 [Bulinus truncatus]|nr:Voltage-dependent calcium channel subunit alpha-2/delta-2 [Bulinus truncatus]
MKQNMAPTRGIYTGLIAILKLTFALSLCFRVSKASNGNKKMPQISDIVRWASIIDDALQALPYVYPVIKKQYEEPVKHIQRDYYPVNGTELVADMSAKLSKMMHQKMDALGKLVEAAETAARNYTWNKNLMKESVNYVSSKDIKDLPLTYVERFKKEVNFNTSSVHIPVEIYDGDIEILNGLKWSAALDEHFKQNYNNDPDILWQYFGSHTGFMRSFPAAAWPPTPVDLYDVRRQSWYTQGSSSPKDMLILIDKSGSTHGQSLQLMRNAVKSILDTLGENDFVNIIEFAENVEFVSKCFNHTAFVQANFRNKKLLEKDVDNITASGQADFSKAIQFAFQKFEEFNNTTNETLQIGANCNKVIMLLTDGGTDNAESVFRQYNWPDKPVRVFTYAVGPTPNPVHAIRWMACANRGYFSQIPAMGAIRAKVQEYIPVLSRPQVIQNKKSFEWGNIYEDYMGLGMMTTVTLPVYNRSEGSSNQTILGVMGIDVTTSKLEAETPFEKIGLNGYSFAINPNGYVVFHPNLLPTGKSVKEPPNIDMLELEIDEDNPILNQVRSDMIDGKTGNMSTRTLFLSPDQRYVTFNTATYSYTTITNTSFRLAIAVPKYQQRWPQYRYKDDFKKINFSNVIADNIAVFVAPWNYHKNLTKQKNLSIADIGNLLKEDPNKDNWNEDLLSHLYWDSTAINFHFLKTNYASKLGAFIMTNGGMTVVIPKSKASYFGGNYDPRNSSIYKRAQHYNECIFVTDYVEDEGVNSSAVPCITVACAVSLQDVVDKIVFDKPAVVGEWIAHARFIEILKNSTVNANVINCGDTKKLLCYLVDDGGFLVATNAENALKIIGTFFGEVESSIFAKLQGSLFGRSVQYDFQAMCKKENNTISAGHIGFKIPTFNMLFEVLNTGWWTSKVTWLYSSFNFFSWLFSPVNEVYAQEDESEEEKCVKEIQQYYIKDGSLNVTTGGLECSNYTRNFTAVKLIRSSLLFIVVDATEDCSSISISQAPRRLSDSEEKEKVCEMARNPRKRMRLSQCYNQDKREDDSQCGGMAIQASVFSVMSTLLLVIWHIMQERR